MDLRAHHIWVAEGGGQVLAWRRVGTVGDQFKPTCYLAAIVFCISVISHSLAPITLFAASWSLRPGTWTAHFLELNTDVPPRGSDYPRVSGRAPFTLGFLIGHCLPRGDPFTLVLRPVLTLIYICVFLCASPCQGRCWWVAFRRCCMSPWAHWYTWEQDPIGNRS